MIYATRRERIEAEKRQRRGRHMRSVKVGVAGFATFAGVSVAGLAPAHANDTVESGDTLSQIAAQHDNVTVSGNSSSSASTSTTSSASAGTHTVVSGDTLGRIASQHGTSVSALMSENGLSSTWIYPGDQLTIPGAGSSSSTSSTSSAAAPSTSSSSSSSSSNSSSSSSSSSSTNIDASNSERVSATSTASASASTSGASWATSTANSGASYRLGANGEGNTWDCSSFSQRALSQDGKSIPRTSAAQYASAQKISHGQLQAGDLVFYGNGGVSHVAVYVGNDQIAHARNPSAGLSVDSLSTYSQYNNVIGYGRY